MKTQTAIRHFGTASALAKACGVSKAAVAQWGEYPPIGRQFQIQIKSKGKLKAEARSAVAQGVIGD